MVDPWADAAPIAERARKSDRLVAPCTVATQRERCQKQLKMPVSRLAKLELTLFPGSLRENQLHR